MSKKFPIVAAIPVYNMAESLSELLPQVLAQGYDDVVVMDDASTDGITHDVLHSFAPDITTVFGQANVGSGGNRNRIFSALQDKCAIVHFLDADIRLKSEDNPGKIRGIPMQNISFIGGLVLGKDGTQSTWNYGPRQCLHGDIGAMLQSQRVKLPRNFATGLLDPWPDPRVTPVARRIFWPLESNMIIRSDVLSRIGGFDESIREHDIQLPAYRAHKLGLMAMFTPDIAVQHLEVNIRPHNRGVRKILEEVRMIRTQYGWKEWLLPDGQFRPPEEK